MVTTARDIGTFALVKAGIVAAGRPASAADINNAITDLQDMLALWTTERWMSWDMLNIGKVSTGAASYTAGPGGDYNVNPRPNRIASAFLRQLTQPTGLNTDTPVTVIPAREEYDRIALKGLVSFTRYVFLDTSYPLAVVRPYPVPTASLYSLFLTFKDVMPQITIDTDMSSFPPPYIPAMKFNLARWLRQGYGKGSKPDVELNKIASSTLDIVKNSNLQIPELVMPRSLVTSNTGYNILSDQFG